MLGANIIGNVLVVNTTDRLYWLLISLILRVEFS